MTAPTDDPEDDWAPLSPEQLAMRPGELAGEGRGVSHDELLALSPPAQPVRAEPPSGAPGAPPAPTETPSEPESPADVAPKERGERMLRRLFGRVARSGDSDSIVTTLQRKDERSRRQRELAATCESELRGQFVRIEPRQDEQPEPPELDVDARSDLDARELEPWFLELPEHEQQRLRKVWADERSRYDWTGKAARTRLVRAAAYSGAMFFVNAVLMTFLTGDLLRVLFYVPVGAVAGVVATLVGGTRFHFMCAGALAFTLLEGANLLANPFMFYGLLLSISTMGLVGLDRELRMSGGHRDD